MSSGLLLEVAPDLSFAFDPFPEAFVARVASHFHYFLDRGLRATSRPLRIAAQPPPEAMRLARRVERTEPIEVRRLGELSHFAVPGISGWCDCGRLRAGVVLEEPSERDLDLFTWYGMSQILFQLGIERGWLCLHAAAVATRGRGILLPGDSGAGKSTLFRMAHRAGLDVLSDDLVWLRESPEGVRLRAFPRGRCADAVPGPTADEVILHCIVFPRIVGAYGNEVRRLSLADGLGVLTSQIPVALGERARGEVFRALVRLADAVPLYGLDAGREGDRVPEILEALCEGAR